VSGRGARRGGIAAAIVCAIGVMCVSAGGALTEMQRAQILDEAQTAYDRGVAVRGADPAGARESFAEAVTRFDQLVNDGIVNGQLSYNLGNAHLQLGAIGPAILAYRRAERLVPGDPRLAHNLEYARSLQRNQIAESGDRALAGALLRWHHATTTTTRLTTLLVLNALFWAALIGRVVRPGGAWRWLALAAVLLAIPCGASVAADLLGAGPTGGVVLADDVVVRMGNGVGFGPKFEEPLYAGVEFTVLERRPGWFRIELSDHNTGWIEADKAALIGR